jgi:hypothetical protein
MTELLHSATRKLVEDAEFLNTIELKVNKIMHDGKLDSRDIPMITLLIAQCTNNLSKFNLSYEELTEVLQETILYLLNHFKAVDETNKSEYESIINTTVELVMMKPKVKSCLHSFFNKIAFWRK